MSEACGNCRYFRRQVETEDAGFFGECRVLPPIIMEDGDEGRLAGVWPIIDEEAWCGAWESAYRSTQAEDLAGHIERYGGVD